MRKVVCTASLFMVFIAAAIGSVMIKIPNSWNWWDSTRATSMSCPLLLWLFLFVISPAVVVVAGLLLIWVFWTAAEMCCGRLRDRLTTGEKR